MGVYDFLKGPLSCGCVVGENSGDFQIKWFSDLDNCFRSFYPGDLLPGRVANGDRPLGWWKWCKCGRTVFLFARIKNNRFVGFKESEQPPDGWKSPGEILFEDVKKELSSKGIQIE
jgi:hypothetical protein